jgi:hypothetical protein
MTGLHPAWGWLATIIYPLLFVVLGVHVLLLLLGWPVVCRKWVGAAMFVFLMIAVAGLGITNGIYPFTPGYIKPATRLAFTGLTIVLMYSAVDQIASRLRRS